jgi:hypothetical protein
MKQPQKDIIIFSSFIIGFSIICIWVAVTIAFENGIVLGIVLGIGILLCVGVRQFMKEPSQSVGEVRGKD